MSLPTSSIDSRQSIILLTDLETVGNWRRQQTLGSGTFANITLWVNMETNEKIAIKQFKNKNVGFIQRQIDYYNEKWQQEIQMVKRMKCESLVKALELPSEFETLRISTPVLALEFCSGGDLRKWLCRTTNCCGLVEREVRQVLKQIATAIEYLHSQKIIHRDLKPENIVLQPLPNKKTLYKLTDLGYAKQLSESAIANSFVGTLEYLAPELFMKKTYSSAVDNWSFGLMVYEIITGRRPFLHNHSMNEILKYVKMKKSSNISIELEFHNNDSKEPSIRFSDEISRFNHITSTLKQHVESWLKTVLEYEPTKRGGDKVFAEIRKIVNRYTIQIFHLETYEILSYEITVETELGELRKWIAQQTRIVEEHQHLILPNGENITRQIGKQIITDWYEPDHRFEQNNALMLFLYDRSRTLKYIEFYKNLSLPERVERMLLNPQEAMDLDGQRLTWRYSVWTAQQTLQKYHSLHAALHGCFLNSIRLYNDLQVRNHRLSLSLQALHSTTGSLKQFVIFHVTQFLQHLTASYEDDDEHATIDSKVEFALTIVTSLREVNVFKQDMINKLFNQSSKIVPKLSRDNAIIQRLLAMDPTDESLNEKYNDILSELDSLRKRKKDETSNNNLMIMLLCDYFKIIENLMSSSYDVLKTCTDFMKNIDILMNRNNTLKTEVDTWLVRVEGDQRRLWKKFSATSTFVSRETGATISDTLSKLNLHDDGKGGGSSSSVTSGGNFRERLLEKIKQLESAANELNAIEVNYDINPLETHNLLK